ncbi:MAG: hypothetical protein WB523_05045 [Candidatus Sulfotelmatobacter sp.]
MPRRLLWRGVLTVALSLALAIPAKADNLDNAARNIVIGIVAVTAAIAVVVTVLVMHESKKKRTITGCVNSTAGGMTITDEKDNQTYAIVGDTASIKPGDKMRLRGRKAKPNGSDKTLVWESRQVDKDFGVCHP